MRFASVAERELRAAARRSGTYRLRWFTALGFFALLLWLGWVMGAFRGGSRELFIVFAVLGLLYGLLVGATGAADTLSRERREGTLGLLFLTNLNSAEIVGGKFCSAVLGTAYPLLAIFPILALPVLLGGITAGQIALSLMALANAGLFGVALGMVASAVCVRPFAAVAAASALALAGGVGTFAVAAALEQFTSTKWLANWIAPTSPISTLMAALQRGPKAIGEFWLSLGVVALQSLLCLGLVTLWVGRTWRDRPSRRLVGGALKPAELRRRERRRAASKALRNRLMGINPLFWLASRARVSSKVFMLLTLAVVGIAMLGLAPLFSALLPTGGVSPTAGVLIAWVIALITLHALALYYAAMSAAQRLAEDRQMGALELLFSTPLTHREISRGLWLAYLRRLVLPVVTLTFAHGVLLWLIGMVILEAQSDELPAGIGVGRLLWGLLLGRPVGSLSDAWASTMILRGTLLALVFALVVWGSLGWVARWLGVRLRHPGFAPLTSLALLLAPPATAFVVLCWAFEEWGVMRMPARLIVPLMLFLPFVLGFQHCLMVALWAAGRLRRDLRDLVAGALAPRRHAWLPRAATVGRLVAVCAAQALLIFAFLTGYHALQNWRARAEWRAFQAELAQRGESLDLARWLPAPAPAELNFARDPAFQDWLTLLSDPRSGVAGQALNSSSQVTTHFYGALTNAFAWLGQRPLDLATNAAALGAGSAAASATSRVAIANLVISALQPLEAPLQALAEASTRRPRFELTPERDAGAVLATSERELERLAAAHHALTMRASARLELGEVAGAAADVGASLRLAHLARDSSHGAGTLYGQVLLLRSLQPLWEGLVGHQWDEAHLADLQGELDRFDFVADYTNAVRRLVLAHVDQWQAVAKSGGKATSMRTLGGYSLRPEWRWQPHSWWYVNCAQLHRAGEKAVRGVNPLRGEIRSDVTWQDVGDLPLDETTRTMLMMTWWYGGYRDPQLAQTALDLARAACALERHRLAHGAFPPSLEALVPEELPRLPVDCVRGEPLLYVREGPDRFRLIGVGFNGVHDQNRAGSDDWVWAFPAPVTNAPSAGETP